jgi:hypothetical protein
MDCGLTLTFLHSGGAGHAFEIMDGVTKIVLQDITFEDIYLCSGQLNMEIAALFKLSVTFLAPVQYATFQEEKTSSSLSSWIIKDQLHSKIDWPN